MAQRRDNHGQGSHKANRGPSAGPSNRAALVSAAREIFDERGLDAPLSAIARAAGVGQGSLYRHFPDRVSLAIAVFSENMDALEQLAGKPTATLGSAAELVTHYAEGTAAIFPVLGRHKDDPRVSELERRLRAVFEALWDRGEGFVGPRTSVDDLILAIAMIAGLAAQTPRETRHQVTQAAWAMLRPGLAQ